MSTDMAGQGKPERHPVYKFFTNGFVQGVAVFIALAVAFSGKLDSKGTLVAVLVAGAIGAIGIYTHWSNTVRQKVLAGLSILIYGCVLWAFYSYLTSKPSMSAGNATFQQQQEMRRKQNQPLKYGYLEELSRVVMEIAKRMPSEGTLRLKIAIAALRRF